MTQKLKETYPLHMQLHADVWIARGVLPFPQGIQYVYQQFAGQRMSDVYNHPYLLEAETWPDQPSPQFHLTEEIQSILKITKGMTAFEDRGSGLDNTMTLVRSSTNPKRFLLYNPTDIDGKTNDMLNKEVLRPDCTVTDIVIPTKQTWQSLRRWSERFGEATIWHAGSPPPNDAWKTPLSDAETARLRLIPGADSAPSATPEAAADNFEPRPFEALPDVHLFRIEGDAQTNEHVLYHPASRTLACTDLYHGPYTDLDPLNGWLCRFWFKMQRLGNHKSKIFLPQYRKTQIETQKGVDAMQRAVDAMTRTLDLSFLVFSHGTPPIAGEGEAVEYLRAMYALPPLDPKSPYAVIPDMLSAGTNADIRDAKAALRAPPVKSRPSNADSITGSLASRRGGGPSPLSG